MAAWQGAFSRGVGGVALGLGFLAATAGPAMADTCASIGSNPSLNGPVPYSDILPPFTHTTFDVILAQGDRLTFAWTNLSFPFFEVVILGESEELIETNPEEPSDGSHEYVASKDATFTIRAFGTGGFGGGSQSVTCTPSGGGGGGDDDNGGGGGDDDDNDGGDDDPVTGAARAAAERDALVRGLRSAGPFVSPAGLPGFVRPLEPEIDTSVRFRDPGIIIDIEEEIRKSDCAEYQKKLAEARARRDRLSADLASALQELGQLNASLAAGVITEVAYNQAETANRTKRRRIELELQGLDGAIAELESAVRDCPDMPAGPAGTAAAAATAQIGRASCRERVSDPV